MHPANPEFWRNAAGGTPQPFTMITLEDILNGTWKPTSDIPSMPLWPHHAMVYRRPSMASQFGLKRYRSKFKRSLSYRRSLFARFGLKRLQSHIKRRDIIINLIDPQYSFIEKGHNPDNELFSVHPMTMPDITKYVKALADLERKGIISPMRANFHDSIHLTNTSENDTTEEADSSTD